MKHRKLKRDQKLGQSHESPKSKPQADNPPAPEEEEPLKGDDRNIISDKDFDDVSMEERLWLFWGRNKQAIIAGAVTALVVVTAIVGYRLYETIRVESLQENYLEARANENQSAFAEKNASAPLGGLAALRQANQAYQQDNFQEARKAYEVATKGLKETPMKGRARIGLGVTLARLGETDEAAQTLREVVDADKILDAFKAEALYHLAILALESGNAEQAELHVARISDLNAPGSWQYKANFFDQLVPERAPAANNAQASAKPSPAPEDQPDQAADQTAISPTSSEDENTEQPSPPADATTDESAKPGTPAAE